MNKLTKTISLILAAAMLAALVSCEKTPTPEPEKELISYTVTPAAGEIVEYHTDDYLSFVSDAKNDVTEADRDFNISFYADGKKELSIPKPVTFGWEGGTEAEEYLFEIATDSKFSDEVTYTVTGESFELYDLLADTAYYWRVSPVGEKPEDYAHYAFITAEGPRMLFVEGVSNVRDLGGYETSYGVKVKQGMLYRGGRFNETWANPYKQEITERGIDTLINVLGVKTEVDLRGDTSNGTENGQMNNGVIPEIEYLLYPCSWSKGAEGKRLYDANKTVIKRLFEEVLCNEDYYPLYFHCSIGTDRTGMVAYLGNGILGVDEKDLQIDYLLSNFGKINSSRSLKRSCKVSPLKP